MGDFSFLCLPALPNSGILILGKLLAIPIELTPAQESRLRIEANRLDVPPEDLVRLAVEDLLARPDAEFQDAAERVLEKNRELYERLA